MTPQEGYQIVLAYDGRLADASYFEKEILKGDEPGSLSRWWKQLSDFSEGKAAVHPDELMDLLMG
jgi:hypothetical protein